MQHRSGTFRIALAILFVAAVGILLAKTTVSTYTAIEIPAAAIDPGTTTMAGDNVHVRGVVKDYQRISNDPRENLTYRVTMNLNLDRSGKGAMWGTATAEVGGGKWDGTFQGWFDYATFQGEYDSIVKGSGDFAGLHAREHCVYTGPSNPGSCTGTITDTGGK